MILPLNSIESFFQKNNIGLAEEKLLPAKDLYQLYLEASKHGRGFLCFIHYAVINTTENGIATNFSSPAELYEFYVAFMTSFAGSKNN